MERYNINIKAKKELIIATYNIQFSINRERLIDNIINMTNKGVSLFCLQEVVWGPGKTFMVDMLLKELGGEWKAICNLGAEKSILGMGNCIIWNTKVLKLESEQKVFLPKYSTLAIHEKVFSWIVGGVMESFQRRVIIGCFELTNTKKVRVTNVHLDQNGGLKNRKRQLEYLMNNLQKNKFYHEIVCGDFNSFDLLESGKEMVMHKEVMGGEFRDISKDTGWTADLNNINLVKGRKVLEFLIKKLQVHIRKKLDYLWVKNISSSKCEKLSLDGSDHKPLVAYLEI